MSQEFYPPPTNWEMNSYPIVKPEDRFGALASKFSFVSEVREFETPAMHEANRQTIQDLFTKHLDQFAHRDAVEFTLPSSSLRVWVTSEGLYILAVAPTFKSEATYHFSRSENGEVESTTNLNVIDRETNKWVTRETKVQTARAAAVLRLVDRVVEIKGVAIDPKIPEVE